MEQYIDKSDIVAEIEKRRSEWLYGSSIEAKYKREECDDILSSLNTIAVKTVDLDESAMDYKKKYVEALERAKDSMNGKVHYELKIGENIMCWIFPELRESEDERIRKEIIDYITYVADTRSNKKEWLAWLEKQGKKGGEDGIQQ